VFVDESGIEDTLCREYARAKRGLQIIGERQGKKKQRYSILAGLRQRETLAPFYFEGYTDTDVFNTWLEHVLLPELNPEDIMIVDNASIHKSPKTKLLLATKGCSLLFLPTYSPNLNPIEQEWAIIKALIRKEIQPDKSLAEVIEKIFKTYGKF